MANIYYNWYKARHICTGCYKRTAAKGKTRCPDCLFVDAERSRAKREKLTDEERKETYRQATQRKHALYERRKADGLCVSCGQRPTLGKSVRCGICKEKARRYAEKHRRKIGQMSHDERSEHDVCYNCGGAPLPGKRLCATCSERSMENLRNANKKIDWYHHPWRNLK